MATTKATWLPAWTVRYDGSRVDEFRVSDRGDVTITVRGADGTTGGQRWARRLYEERFGATRREAIAKFHRKAEHDIELAQQELAEAHRLLACAQGLAAAEPPEVLQ